MTLLATAPIHHPVHLHTEMRYKHTEIGVYYSRNCVEKIKVMTGHSRKFGYRLKKKKDILSVKCMCGLLCDAHADVRSLQTKEVL